MSIDNATRAREIAQYVRDAFEYVRNNGPGGRSIIQHAIADRAAETIVTMLDEQALSTPTPAPTYSGMTPQEIASRNQAFDRGFQCCSRLSISPSDDASAKQQLEWLEDVRRNVLRENAPAPVAGDEEVANAIIDDVMGRAFVSDKSDRLRDRISSALSATRADAVGPFVKAGLATEDGKPKRAAEIIATAQLREPDEAAKKETQ